MNITIQKKHEGKTIYAIPTGNNVRRLYSNESGHATEEFKVIKVNRRYARLERDSGYQSNYDRETGATQDSINSGYGLNAGYMFFESISEIAKYHTYHGMLENIRKFFRQLGKPDLTFDQVEVIHNAIFEEDEVS